MTPYEEIRQLIGRIRTRWGALRAFRATRRAALILAAACGAALVAARWISASPATLAAITGAVALVAVTAVAWGPDPAATKAQRRANRPLH